MNLSMEFSRKVSLAYGEACKPLCRELNLPQTAFDILLFLANNPAYSTAARKRMETAAFMAHLRKSFPYCNTTRGLLCYNIFNSLKILTF